MATFSRGEIEQQIVFDDEILNLMDFNCDQKIIHFFIHYHLKHGIN